jgi:hypothetical protein
LNSFPLVSPDWDIITEPVPAVLLGLVVVSRFPVSVALGLGILLIDTLERSEPKMSRVAVDSVSSPPPLDDGGEAEKDLSGVSVVVTFRELRMLVSLADGELGGAWRELNSTIEEEFDESLDGAANPVPRIVVFAILVVEEIDREEFRAVVEFGFFEPLLDTVFSLLGPTETLVSDCWVEPVMLPLERNVWFDAVVDAVNSAMPGPRPAMEPFVKVPLEKYMLLKVVLFESCLLSVSVPGVSP